VRDDHHIQGYWVFNLEKNRPGSLLAYVEQNNIIFLCCSAHWVPFEAMGFFKVGPLKKHYAKSQGSLVPEASTWRTKGSLGHIKGCMPMPWFTPGVIKSRSPGGWW